MKIINLVEDTAGHNACEFEHGLSFYIETKYHKLLVDTGATDMSLRNARILDIDVTEVDTVVLSHGHYDHSGGIIPFIEKNNKARIYMTETAGGEYYNLKNDLEKYIGIDKRIMQLPQTVKVEGNLKIDDELFLFSGIKGNKYPSNGNLTLKMKTDAGYVQDTFIHEQCLVITEDGKNVLLSGCAHNGIINILDRYYEIYSAYPDMVISGFHMIQSTEYTDEDVENIKNIAKELMKTGSVFYSGHCTGQRAFDIMKEIMGERLIQIHSGEMISGI